MTTTCAQCWVWGPISRQPPRPRFQLPFLPRRIRCWGRGSTSRADKPEIDPGDTILRLDSPGGAAQGPRHGPLQAYVSWASGLGYRVGSRSAPHPPLPYGALRMCPGCSSISPAPLNFSPMCLPCPSPQLLLSPRGAQMPRKAAPRPPGSQPPVSLTESFLGMGSSTPGGRRPSLLPRLDPLMCPVAALLPQESLGSRLWSYLWD